MIPWLYRAVRLYHDGVVTVIDLQTGRKGESARGDFSPWMTILDTMIDRIWARK